MEHVLQLTSDHRDQLPVTVASAVFSRMPVQPDDLASHWRGLGYSNTLLT